MYCLNRTWFLASLFVLLMFGQACEKFSQSNKVNEPQPVIIVDPSLGSNYLPKANVEAVINFRILKDEDTVRITTVGSAAFLASPVSGIDPRVIAQDLPFSYHNKQAAKKNVGETKGKKLTDKEKKTIKRLTDKPDGLTYDKEKITQFDLNFNFPKSAENALPERFSFKMQKDKEILSLIGIGDDFDFAENEILAKFGSKSTTKISGLGFTGKEVKNYRLAKASTSATPAGFDFPNQFFVKNQTDPEPTDLGTSIKIDTSKGYTFTWLNNTKADSKSFMNIRIYVLKSQNPKEYSNMLSFDTTDNGEATLTADHIKELGIDKEVDAEVYMDRIIPYEVQLAEAVSTESGAENSEKSKKEVTDLDLLGYSDEQLLEYLASEDKSDEDAEADAAAEDGKIGKPDTDVPVAVFLCSIGTKGMVKIAPPPPAE